MNTCIPTGLLAGVLAAATPSIAAPGEPAAPQPATAMKSPRPGLLTGGQPASADWSRLAAGGVSTVINLRPRAELGERDEAAEVRAAGLRYEALPIAGAGDITLDNARALSDLLGSADGGVLVHCASGNRVGALLALAAWQADGLSPREALELGRRAGLTGLEPRVRELLGLPPAD